MRKVYCINCDDLVDYTVSKVHKTIEVGDVQVDAEIKEARCINCGELLFVDEIEGYNDIVVYDEYKKKMGLLTSNEIKEIRKKRNMTQKDLANFLGIGEKDITRYENGSIQTKSIDRFIRAFGNYYCYKSLFKTWTLLDEEALRTHVAGGIEKNKKSSKAIKSKIKKN